MAMSVNLMEVQERSKSASESAGAVGSSGCNENGEPGPDASGSHSEIQAKKAHKPSNLCDSEACTQKEIKCVMEPFRGCNKKKRSGSSWYHFSANEHMCHRCLAHYHRSKKYKIWRDLWSKICKTEPSVKRFIAHEILPVWLRCTEPKCGKWRPVIYPEEMFPAYVHTFTCRRVFRKKFKGDFCAIEEDPSVSRMLEVENWMGLLSFQPLLKNIPGIQFLRQFCYEDIGLYPTSIWGAHRVAKHVELFNKDLGGKSPIWVSADKEDPKEVECIPESLLPRPLYMALRNLVIGTWYLSPHERLTVNKVNIYLNCQGLVRIYLLSFVEYLIKFLTARGTINYGLLPLLARPLPLHTNTQKVDVIIVGAGIAGLTAARHFHNMGLKYMVLEASNRMGGRARHDVNSKGTQVISGLLNNPFTVLSHQAKCEIHEVAADPIFLSTDRHCPFIEPWIVQKMCQQFGGVMHAAIELSREWNRDSAWLRTLKSHQKDFQEKLGVYFTKEEMAIFDFLLKLYEIDTRTDTSSLTLKNFEFSKILGADGIVNEGFGIFIRKLSDGLNVLPNNNVISVTCRKSVKVETVSKCFVASKVLITAPLPILRNKYIVFDPPLPESKMKAFNSLADVLHEKVIIHFPTKFWEEPLRGAGDILWKKFAVVSSKPLSFQCFIDISDTMVDKTPTLLTFITNSVKDVVKKKQHKRVVNMCVGSLRSVFQRFKVEVPDPVSFAITDWANDRNFLTSGSCVKVDSTFDCYDEIAKPVNDTIFFAGEATFRESPNSITGAFLSGLRDAVKICEMIHPFPPFDAQKDFTK